MLVNDFSRCVLEAPATVKAVVENLNASGLKICLIVSEDNRLLGIISDGDIRRGLLAGETLESDISLIMNKKFVSGVPEAPISTLSNLGKSRGVTHLPIVDSEGKLAGLFIAGLGGEKHPKGNTVVVMAGGMGLRLRPLTETVPKPLIQVGGKPIVQHTIEALRAEGFSKFVIALNYLGNQIEDFFGDGTDLDIQISYLKEAQPLGTGGALSLLEGDFQEPILVVNGDVILGAKMAKMLDFHEQAGGLLTVGVKYLETQIPFGVLDLSDDRIVAVREKPLYRHYVNAGVYVLDPLLLKEVPRDTRFDMTDLLERAIQTSSARAFPIHESWIDLGRHEDLDRARQDYESF